MYAIIKCLHFFIAAKKILFHVWADDVNRKKDVTYVLQIRVYGDFLTFRTTRILMVNICDELLNEVFMEIYEWIWMERRFCEYQR